MAPFARMLLPVRRILDKVTFSLAKQVVAEMPPGSRVDFWARQVGKRTSRYGPDDPRTLQARIVVDNKGEKLKRDMYCTVTVTAGTISNAIAVPDAAVLRDDQNQPFVYLATNNNQFGRRPVDIGESQNGQTQIQKGLSAGDRVAGNGSLFLQFANSLQH